MQIINNSKVLDRNIHTILAHSYFFFFLSFLISLFLDLIFPLRFIKYESLASLGGFLIALGTLLVLWAQYTSRNLDKSNITKDTFCHGPYCYTRSPTHWGLFFLMFGFGIIINATFVIIFTAISFLVSKVFFLRREEEILVEKYGRPYVEYQQTVSL